jgi:anti-sigma regulatory factor (Ser/Thr protein kinase)
MARRHVTVELPFSPDAVRQARAVVRECAEGLSERVTDNAELLVSEAVTNAVLHGAPELRLTVTAEDADLSVEVADGGTGMPATGAPSEVDDASGRGLEIIELLSVAWGVDVDPAHRGKVVWFRMTDFSQPEADRVAESGHEEGGMAWN